MAILGHHITILPTLKAVAPTRGSTRSKIGMAETQSRWHDPATNSAFAEPFKMRDKMNGNVVLCLLLPVSLLLGCRHPIGSRGDGGIAARLDQVNGNGSPELVCHIVNTGPTARLKFAAEDVFSGELEVRCCDRTYHLRHRTYWWGSAYAFVYDPPIELARGQKREVKIALWKDYITSDEFIQEELRKGMPGRADPIRFWDEHAHCSTCEVVAIGSDSKFRSNPVTLQLPITQPE